MTELEITHLYTEIGLKIKDARLKKGFNQTVFAQMLNLTRASIVNIEKGRQRASIHLLLDVCKIANLKITDILPELKEEMELSPRLKKIIENSAENDLVRDPKVTKFLIEFTSKEQKNESKKN